MVAQWQAQPPPLLLRRKISPDFCHGQRLGLRLYFNNRYGYFRDKSTTCRSPITCNDVQIQERFEMRDCLCQTSDGPSPENPSAATPSPSCTETPRSTLPGARDGAYRIGARDVALRHQWQCAARHQKIDGQEKSAAVHGIFPFASMLFSDYRKCGGAPPSSCTPRAPAGIACIYL